MLILIPRSMYIYIYMTCTWICFNKTHHLRTPPPPLPLFSTDMFPLDFTTPRRSLAASGDINDLLRVIDTNSNGVVEYEEFLSNQNAMNMCSVVYLYYIYILYELHHMFSPPSTSCGVFDLVYSESLFDSHTIVLLVRQKHGDIIICLWNAYCWNGGTLGWGACSDLPFLFAVSKIIVNDR